MDGSSILLSLQIWNWNQVETETMRSFFFIFGLLAISYPLGSLPDWGSHFVFFLSSAFSCLHPNALSSVVLISVLLYQSAAFVLLDGSRVSEGLI